MSTCRLSCLSLPGSCRIVGEDVACIAIVVSAERHWLLAAERLVPENADLRGGAAAERVVDHRRAAVVGRLYAGDRGDAPVDPRRLDALAFGGIRAVTQHGLLLRPQAQ